MSVLISLLLNGLQLPSVFGASDECDWKAVPVIPGKPAASCVVPGVRERLEAPACRRAAELIREDNEKTLLLRREHLTMIFSQELFYLSRIAPESKGFEEDWREFEDRWKKRVSSEPEMMIEDQKDSLGKDRCRLHHLLGMDCGKNPALNYIAMKKAEAKVGHTNRALGRKFPLGLAYDLIEVRLILRSTRQMAADAQAKSLSKEVQAQLGHEKQGILDYLLSYFPELIHKSALDREIKKITLTTSAVSRVDQAMTLALAKGDVSLSQRKLIVDNALTEALREHPLEQASLDRIQEIFQSSDKKILGQLDEQLIKGKVSSSWLWKQEYLLNQALVPATERTELLGAPTLAGMICSGQFDTERSEHRSRMIHLVGGGLALASGVGALFEVGGVLGTAFVASSFGLMTGLSALDVYTSASQLSARKDLFIIHQASSSEVELARKNLRTEIPWAFVNLALASPAVVLTQISTARQAAALVQDLDKVRRLDLFRRAIIGTTLAANVGLSAYNVKEGFQAAVELIHEAREGVAEQAPPVQR